MNATLWTLLAVFDACFVVQGIGTREAATQATR
jgi:hypothetical protein